MSFFSFWRESSLPSPDFIAAVSENCREEGQQMANATSEEGTFVRETAAEQYFILGATFKLLST